MHTGDKGEDVNNGQWHLLLAQKKENLSLSLSLVGD